MKTKSLALVCLFLLLGLATFAQNFTISGSLKDASNGEDLIGAGVSVKELPGTGATSNVYGFYSLSLPAGNYTLVYDYIGFESQERSIELNANQSINIELGQGAEELVEVVVSAEKEDKNVSETAMSVTKINPKDIESIPVLFGEKDIVKILQLTPGVKSAGEGSAGFYVRGGGLDQNLILLDEAPVYNASHLLGFFSVFNSDALKDVTLYKGGMPARYGGRGSSVMDVIMKDGNNKHYSVSGGIGLISSKLTVEGPIVKDKGSFIVSGRRTYADLFLKASSDESLKSTKLYFYDLNLKANYRIGERDRIFLSGYFGRDVLGLQELFGFDWGNATGTLRWNHLYNEKLFGNTSVIYSNYNYKFRLGEEDEGFKVSSAIRDWNLKQDFSLFANANNTIKFGGNMIYHTFLPGKIETGERSSFNQIKIPEKYALEGGLYFENDHKISEKISAQYGLRWSIFNLMGDGTASTYDEEGNKISETEYGNWESIQFYNGFEPRLSLKYQLNSKSSIKTAYNRNYQYLHLLSNTTGGSPTDVWIPSSNNIKPQIIDQVSLGYFRNFMDNAFEFSIEAYYKSLQNQVEYRNGADLVLNGEVEGELVYGVGKSYGAEFYLRKRKGKLTGWLSYTLARSLRSFDAINNGKEFSARQDRIHDVAIVLMYDLSPKIKLSANWVFNTGDAITFPSGRYEIGDYTVPYYTERNGYRMPNYHRGDIGLTWMIKKTDRRESSLNFSIYNVYNRENAYTITFQQNEDDPSITEAVQTSLFKMVPSFAYNFKF